MHHCINVNFIFIKFVITTYYFIMINIRVSFPFQIITMLTLAATRGKVIREGTKPSSDHSVWN